MRLMGGLRLAGLLLCLCGAASEAKAQLNFAYTGALYGYFRDDVAPPEARLIANLNRHGYALRLAMGGNYSPEFGASLQLPEVRSALNPEESYPECETEPVRRQGRMEVRDFYKDDGHIGRYAYCDNVTRFFMKAGYRAVVPSDEDFIYGSGWLHLMALQMRDAASSRYIVNGDHRLNMLAANLRMRLTVKVSGDDKQFCPLLFASVGDLQHARACDIPPDDVDEEPEEGVSYVSTMLGGSRTWIIGVVGDDVFKRISKSKRTLCMNVRHESETKTAGEVVDCAVKHTTEAAIFLGDPANAVMRLMRTMRQAGMKVEDHVVVMAQMSHEDAAALGVRLQRRFQAMPDSGTYPLVTAILSGADGEQFTPTVEQSFAGRLDRPVVLTPRPAYETDYDPKTDDRLVEPESYAAFYPLSASQPLYRVQLESPGGALGLPGATTALQLLWTEVNRHTVSEVKSCADPAKQDNCRLEMTEFLLRKLVQREHGAADVAMLEHADFFMGVLPEGFADYEMCAQMALPGDRCRLWVALDRVLWRANYMEHIAVKGETLLSVLSRSENFSRTERDTVDSFLSNQWLETYGIMRAAVRRKSIPNQVANVFSPPEHLACAGSDAEAEETFCINGKAVDPERAYWVVSSDELANDTAVYTELGGTREELRQRSDVGVSEAMANAILHEGDANPQKGLEAVATAGDAILNQAQLTQQQQKLFRIDFGKAVVAYMNSGSTSGDTYSAHFQGVGDSRASQASQRTNDFELQLRTSLQLGHAFFNRTSRLEAGTDTMVEYARVATGSLDGTPVTPMYSRNTISTSPFLQIVEPVNQPSQGPLFLRYLNNLGFMRLASRGGIISVAMERQLLAPPLFFNYQTAAGGTGVNAVRIDRNWGVKPRAGLRLESGESRHWFQTSRSSFLEAGLQFSQTFHLLKSLQLQNPGEAPSITCSADGSSGSSSLLDKISLPDCLRRSQYAVGAQTVGNATYGDVGVGGIYWKVHLRQPILGDKISLVTDSDAEANFNAGRGRALSTQTRYAIPLTVALEARSMGNLVFAPSVDFFFYSSQIDHAQQLYRSIKLSVRWYFDRDSRVPLRKQVRLTGPPDSDGTGTRAMQ